MKIGRRSFLKILGGTAAATIAAPLIMPSVGPLFIPSDRLDMGVPTGRLSTSTDIEAARMYSTTVHQEYWPDRNVPMLLAHDEFRPPGWQQFGREKVPAGTTLLVDRTTAERWITHGVGTPGPAAPMDLQTAAAIRQANRIARTPIVDDPRMIRVDGDPLAVFMTPEPIEVLRERQAERESARDRRWSTMVERASAKLKRATRSPEMAWWDDA